MTDEMDALWLRMLPLLEAISNKVSRSQPSHLKEIGRSDNETYLMRAYLAFKKQNGGSEVAVTVDIRRQGNLFKMMLIFAPTRASLLSRPKYMKF